MHTTPFQCILSSLALLGTAHGGIVPIAECTAQAWVRAPDLTPNTIVHGDARVKISAGCPAVENVLLGLRFKERSFVKALRSREDVKRLNPEYPRHDPSSASLWALPSRFANKSVEEAYEEIITNKDLWIVREEERAVFETMQPISMGSSNYGALRDAVQDFSILVPSTNFPPALNTRVMFAWPMEREIAHVEWIYEYFAQISFSNGTTKEISAGVTAFQPLYDPARASQGLTSATVELKPISFGDMGKTSTTNYSIELNADSGFTFVAGTKSHAVTAVVTRTGLARTFSAPLKVFLCVIQDSSPKWASEYDMSDFNSGHRTPASVLRATPLADGDKARFNMWSPQCSQQHDAGVSVIMPNSTSYEIEANEVVTTLSAPLKISIDVDDSHIPTFETYYQTLANSFTITLQTPRGEDEDVDPDDPSGEGNWGPQFEDDEEAWVPWEKKGMARSKTWRSYSGRVATVVHPTTEETSSTSCLRASMDMDVLGQVILSDETGCEQRSLIHYLDEGARAPTFVDRNAIHKPSSVDPAEQELRAPFLQPVVSSPPEGEERSYRYYHPSNNPLIYVGETWAKKVANKN
ncbi:hypothetical protein J3R82DRAFT_6490 [Butyriboletus roseoflavus]|nr:hypothetical protein J3R82DRAFT_6490 [Butyriboletus roseoflavus]